MVGALVLVFAAMLSNDALAGQRAADLPLGTNGLQTGVRYKMWFNTTQITGPVLNPPDPGGTLGTPTTFGTQTVAPFIQVANTPPKPAAGTNFIVQWDGLFFAQNAGTYTLGTTSDDASMLYIGVGTATQTLVVDNNNSVPGTQRFATIDLAAGYHKITILYGQGGGTASMAAQWGFNIGVTAPVNNIDSQMYVRPAPTPQISPASTQSSNPLTVTITSPNVTGVGSVTNAANSTTVTGTGTIFTSQVAIGDNIIVGGTTVAVAAIANNTSLTTATAIANANTNAAFQISKQNVTYYTLDGTLPTSASARYGGPFSVNPPATVNAANIITNFDTSYAVPAVYTLPTAADPTFSPLTGATFPGSQTVTISTTTSTAFIYYTTDGTMPTLSNYQGVLPAPAQVTLTESATIQAFVYRAGFNQSNVVSATYTRTDNAPFIVSVLSAAVNNKVNVVFNTPVETASANTLANYSIDQGVTISAVALETGTISLPGGGTTTGDNVTVRLTTSLLVPNKTYTLTVRNVADRTVTSNKISATGITYNFRYFDPTGVYYERWEGPTTVYTSTPSVPVPAPFNQASPGIPGADVVNLTNPAHPFFPDYPVSDPTNLPTSGKIMPTFEEPSNTSILSYGSRMAGYFIAPQTGSYRFYVSADDSAVLNISSDDNPTRKGTSTASVLSGNATNPRQWNKSATQQTGSISMVAGQKYYFETIHKQNINVDNLAVTYVFPPQSAIDTAGSETPPIDNLTSPPGGTPSAAQLAPAIEGLRIVKQPKGRQVTNSQFVVLLFEVAGSAPRTAQWSKNGTPIPGATSEYYIISNFTANDAGTYTCSVSNTITTTPLVSQPAILSLINTAPATFTGINPTFGPANATTNLTITGTNFIDGMIVNVGGVRCTSIVTVNATTITCVTPPLARNQYPVQVIKPGNNPLPTSGAINFTYDDSPVANPAGPFTTPEDPVGGYTFNVTATDQDPTLTFQVTTPPKRGTITVGTPTKNGGTFTCPMTYTPTLDSNDNIAPTGPDSFAFTASDGLLVSTPVTVSISVTPVNDPPSLVNPGPKTVNEDSQATIAITGIGPGGGIDEVGQTVTIGVSTNNAAMFQTPAGANTLAIGPISGGTANVTFIPSFPGTADITVTANDGNSNNSATFTVTVTAVNDPPIITNPGPQTGMGDTAGTIQLTGIAPAPANNPDELASQIVVLSVASSDPTYFQSLTVSQPSSGQATISYIPNIAKKGPVTITVTGDDGAANGKTSIQFTLTLSAINHKPTAVNDSYSPITDKAMTVPASGGVLANDIDLDLDTLQAVKVSDPANGTLVLNADGSFTYTPKPGFAGTDSFTYKADDTFPPNNLSNVATVTLNVGANAAPVAKDLVLNTAEDTKISGNLPGSDPNFDSLTFTIVTAPTKGTVPFGATPGSFTYIPNANVNGTDTFTYKVSDGTLDSNVATVTVNIAAVNDAPDAMNQSVSVGINMSVDILLDAPNGPGGADADGDPLTFKILTQPANGTLTALIGSKTTYKPKAGFTGSDSFTFNISDGKLTSATATVSITVNPSPIFTSGPTLTPSPALVGQTVTGTAASDAVNGTIAWDFGDGSSGFGGSITHVFAAPGIYTVTTAVTSLEGLSAVSIQSILVGIPLADGSPAGAINAGTYGFLVGGAGLVKNCKADLKIDYVNRDKTTLSATVAGLKFPAGLTLGSLAGKSSELTIGTGAGAVTFGFSINASGKGKSTGLPSIALNTQKGTFSFKATQRKDLTDAIISMGASDTTLAGAAQILHIPVTVKIGSQLYMALTLEVTFQQKGSKGTGRLHK